MNHDEEDGFDYDRSGKMYSFREGFIRKKKKSLEFSNHPPPPLKVKIDQNLFFFSDNLKDIFCRRKKNFLEKLEKFHKLGQYYEYFPSFVGQKVVPPYEKKFSLQICMN